MNTRRILAIILLIIGLGLIGFSQYIKKQVAAGNVEISDAQKKVDESGALFSLSPYTKPVGKEFTGSAQKKIDSGKEEVRHYSELSYQLEIGGIVVALLGVVFLVIPRRSRIK